MTLAEDIDQARLGAERERLRSAMLTVMQGKSIDPATGKVEYSYAHPLFWAPYSLVGDGGTK